MRFASKFETSVMKDEEVRLFVFTCVENGSSFESAIQDMRMIDNMLYAERLHLGMGKLAQKTKNGFYRKDSNVYSTFNSILEGRVKENL